MHVVHLNISHSIVSLLLLGVSSRFVRHLLIHAILLTVTLLIVVSIFLSVVVCWSLELTVEATIWVFLIGPVAPREDRSVRLLSFVSSIESLRCHVEILDFEVLDSGTKDSVHLAQVNQLVVNAIDSYGFFFLFFNLTLVHLFLF